MGFGHRREEDSVPFCDKCRQSLPRYCCPRHFRVLPARSCSRVISSSCPRGAFERRHRQRKDDAGAARVVGSSCYGAAFSSLWGGRGSADGLMFRCFIHGCTILYLYQDHPFCATGAGACSSRWKFMFHSAVSSVRRRRRRRRRRGVMTTHGVVACQ